MNITEMLITNPVNRPRKPMTPKYLVIHWTANTAKGANARANRNYFQNTTRAASAHYIVDDREIVRCIPENEVAYHVGALKYSHPEARNANSIGIEMCVNADGNFEKMRENTVRLAADICRRYGINPLNDMLRHYDVTRKDCPRFFVQDPAAWNIFRYEVSKAMFPPVLKEEPKVTTINKEAAEKVIAVLGALYNASADQAVKDAAHYAANALREAAGIEVK